MIDRGLETWMRETRALLTDMFGIETEGVGLDTILERGHRQRKTPEEVAAEVQKTFKLETLSSWETRGQPPAET